MRLRADELQRLEAATARLEDIASSTIDLPQTATDLQPRSGAPPNTGTASTPAPAAPAAAPTAPPEPVPESIEEFDTFVATSVGKYVKLSNALGGLVAEQVRQGP